MIGNSFDLNLNLVVFFPLGTDEILSMLVWLQHLTLKTIRPHTHYYNDFKIIWKISFQRKKGGIEADLRSLSAGSGTCIISNNFRGTSRRSLLR